MQEMKDDHHGHAIITSVSGPDMNAGPFVASYTVWKIETRNSYRAVIQGALTKAFAAPSDARSAAMTEARERLDAMLKQE